MLSQCNLPTRLLVLICSVTMVAFAVTISTVSFKAGTMVREEALSMAEEVAYRYGNSVKAEIEVALNAARTLAQAFEGFKKSGFSPDRSNIDDMLKAVLEKNPCFLGVWTCWEPKQFDDMDEEFANLTGHDNTGRYIPYWYRDSGEIRVKPLIDYEIAGAGDYYLLAKRTGRETIINPYLVPAGDKKILITSLASPIAPDGAFCGVTGVDIPMDVFQEMIARIKPYGSGNASLIANNGTFVAHADGDKIGKDVGDSGIWREAKHAVKSGHPFVVTDKGDSSGIKILRIFIPIQVGFTETPWAFLVNVPMDAVMAKATGIRNTTILLGVVSMVIMVVVVFFVAQGITRPLNRIVGELSQGADHVSATSTQFSETSQLLASRSSQQASSLQETSSYLEELSSMTRRNASNTQAANSVAGNVRTAARESHEAMGKIALVP